jgi:inner membrane protein
VWQNAGDVHNVSGEAFLDRPDSVPETFPIRRCFQPDVRSDTKAEMAGVGHVAVGMAAARWRERRGLTAAALTPAMVGWGMLSLLPDSDVIGFTLGVPYDSTWGHRGVTHSFTFALVVGATVALLAAWRRRAAWRTGLLATLVVLSHGLLDTLTDGGRGVALLWPFSDARFAAPWHPLPVSPIGFGLLSSYGVRVALHELVLFAPVFLYAFCPRPAAGPAYAVP